MGRRRRVSFAASAVQDLECVRDCRVSQLAPEVGDRQIREVMARVEQLTDFPDSGRVVSEFEIPWLRELIHAPFRIVYRVDDERVRVVRVWRSERLTEHPPDGIA